jgi:hypothetical protein
MESAIRERRSATVPTARSSCNEASPVLYVRASSRRASCVCCRVDTRPDRAGYPSTRRRGDRALTRPKRKIRQGPRPDRFGKCGMGPSGARLARGTDAGDSTGLTVALARALPRNPAAVLAALDEGPVIGPEAVCGVPFIEPSSKEIREYLDVAIPAVTRIEPSVRVPHRSSCVDALHRVQEQTSRQP